MLYYLTTNYKHLTEKAFGRFYRREAIFHGEIPLLWSHATCTVKKNNEIDLKKGYKHQSNSPQQ